MWKRLILEELTPVTITNLHTYLFQKAEGKIIDCVIENMMNRRHSWINVYCGQAEWSHNEEGLESLARYIIRASFSQERMTYIPANESSGRVSKVIYASKDGKSSKTFNALDWLAPLVSHIPHKAIIASRNANL